VVNPATVSQCMGVMPLIVGTRSAPARMPEVTGGGYDVWHMRAKSGAHRISPC
jgi:hypothetical protein